ncbi:hypothetical protein HNQ51_001834 [Inhella inkyongensis]|uniref:Twin transmembrane helix small protein n=1 Tax=Inhella inkyongensis TaxID=392593 RepID=A0A840S7V3_9BURK|nr:DUF2909 domain-containing protein [Inhella inkyongensis]MBB5204520.1 hypothetical protein [Inhella inkyongensis]
MNWIFLIAFIGILGALAAAGFFMLKRPQSKEDAPKTMARALAWRVGISVALFLMILLAWSQGWIEPRGVPLGR